MKLREPRSDCEHHRLAQRMAKLEEKLFSVMQRNAELEAENARLRREVADLKQQLAAALQNRLSPTRQEASLHSRSLATGPPAGSLSCHGPTHLPKIFSLFTPA